MIIATYRETGFVMNGKTRAITPHSGSDDDSDDSDIVEVNLHRGEKLTGWAYMGSHNFTPSAWGTLSGSAFNPTLNASRLSFVARRSSTDCGFTGHQLRTGNRFASEERGRSQCCCMLGETCKEIYYRER